MKATMTVAAAPGGPCGVSQNTHRGGSTLDHPAATSMPVEQSIRSSFSSLYLHHSNAMPFAARKSLQESLSIRVIEQSGGRL